MESERRVGSKVELFLPKKIRETLGLKPKKKVKYRVANGKLIVEPIKSVEELLDEKSKVSITSNESFETRRKLSERLES
ncbi:MAG: AbrB/MazE/SpoVT family DNA-binding domain-containing protein [Candidatus Njordarchaeia archaeon]